MKPAFLNTRLWFGIGLIILLWVLCAFTLNQADKARPGDWYESQLTYLPSGRVLKPAVLGFDEAAASFIWVKGILYFANAYMKHESYEWIGHIVKIVVTLDPRFEYAYQFGGLILQENVSTYPQSLELLLKGIAQFPQNYEMRIFAAMARLTIDSNYTEAGKILMPVLGMKNAPEFARGLALSLLTRTYTREQSLAFFVSTYMVSQSPINREILLQKMSKVYNHPLEDKNEIKILQGLLEILETEPQVQVLVTRVLDEYYTGTLSVESQRVLDAVKQQP